MLNFNNEQAFNFNINAVSGTLRKSHPKSRICIKELNDKLFIFDEEKPRLSQFSKELIILQTMLIGNNRAVIEYVFIEDFSERSEDNDK